eukprot:4577314-Prymnesium_polylepis.1
MGKRGDDSVFYRVAVGNDARHAKISDHNPPLRRDLVWAVKLRRADNATAGVGDTVTFDQPRDAESVKVCPGQAPAKDL